MKFFDFWAFQKIEKMLSHDKILFHMLFGAFHDTPCTPNDENLMMQFKDYLAERKGELIKKNLCF